MTTAEIAKKLGISRGTVSRVLNNHPNVNAKTRQLVQEALGVFEYKPNEAARALVMRRRRKIAVIVFSEPAFFWKQVRTGVDSAIAQLSAHGVSADYFVTDILKPEEQLNLLRRLPGEGYDAIAVAPNDTLLLAEEINALTASGMPVLLLNADIPSANRLCFVGADYEKAGELAAEIMRKTMRGGDIVVMALKEPVVAIDQRITGFRRALSRLGGPQVAQVIGFSRMAEGVFEETLALFRQGANIGGLYVAIGALDQAARAVCHAGLAGKVSLIGHDLSEDTYENMKNGAITATVCHEPFNQGYYAVKLLHNYLLTQSLPRQNILYCKLEAIFESNARYYLNQSLYQG